jgi:hypothetical protein
MWCLSFNITPSSRWVVTLSILEHSPPTWIDSRLIIEEPPQRPAPVAPIPSLLIDAPIAEQPAAPSRSQANKKRGKPKPTISLRLKSGNTQLTPFRPQSQNKVEIEVALEDSQMGTSLQYEWVLLT